MNTKQSSLSPLATELGKCRSRNGKAIAQALAQSWEVLRKDSVTGMNKPSMAAVLAASILNNYLLGQLLTAPEREQLARLAGLVLERYEQRTSPPHKVGSLIAGVLKEK